MLSRSWAALAVLTLACAANTPPRPGDYLDDDSMIRRGRIALADAPATQACVDSAAERFAATDVARRSLGNLAAQPEVGVPAEKVGGAALLVVDVLFVRGRI